MTGYRIATGVAIFWLIVGSASAGQQVTRQPGGSIGTELGYGILLNAGSSLTREWITIHDGSLPADIDGTVGIKTVYDKEKRRYEYTTRYAIKTQEALSAIEVRFLVFDVWGAHIRTLSSTDIVDIAADAYKRLDATWRLYSENEASEYYASIAWIARIRTKDGRVIKTDPEIVLDEAAKFSEQFSEDDLEPKSDTQ